MIYYAQNNADWAPFAHHWKFKSLGKRARHWRYNGDILHINSIHSESLTEFRVADLQDLKGLVKAIFGAAEVREAKNEVG
jgi:hypothetical protein